MNEIDHINGDKIDNRISNLRDVTKLENAKNASISANNTSGFNGVYWVKTKGVWVAKIWTQGKLKHLGYFDKIQDAVAARKLANKKYGFSDRNGL